VSGPRLSAAACRPVQVVASGHLDEVQELAKVSGGSGECL
jgi:hypothetical protein